MSLLYIEEHRHCPNYLFEGHSSFRHLQFTQNSHFTIKTKENHFFLFVLKGRITLHCSPNKTYSLTESMMYSLQYGMDYTGCCLSDVKIIILSFDKPHILCDEFSLIALKKYLPAERTCVAPLPLIPQVAGFLESILFYIDNKMYCRHLQDIKQSEWFFLMRAFYTKEQNALFFKPLIDERNNFVILVKEKSQTFSSVKELADACNMTTKTFTRNFKRHFDCTPKQWLLNRKKEEVKLRVRQSNDKIEALSYQLGFSSGSHLNYYCKTNLEKTVKELREER